MNKQTKATAVGFIAIVLWGCLAFLTDFNRSIPAFQLMAMSFAVGFLVIAIRWQLSGCNAAALFRQSGKVWLLTIFGLFGYHFCYFLALRNAPVLQAGLIAYLWPLFIVLMATWVLKRPVSPLLIFGAVVSLVGCWLLIYQHPVSMEALSSGHLIGYGFALACALIWSFYSVMLGRVGHVPSDFIGWGCLVTAILAGVCHLFLEQTLWPLSAKQWMGVCLLGAGPVGFAFVAWDHGMKKGNVALLGSLSYLAPLISSAILVVFADKAMSVQLLVGGSLILLGAVAAGKASKTADAAQD